MSAADLEDRLARLAAEEVSAPTPRPDDLWRRGRRWQRRRWVAAGLAGAAVLVLASGLVTSILPFVGTEAPEVGPASSEVDARVPDRLFEPSPWLGTLPNGPLVAVKRAERRSWSASDIAVVGISAATGEYGFLDLPDLSGARVALSPDGGRLAYWFVGDPAGEPQLDFGETRATVGVAVRNLRTGEEDRHRVDTEHGLHARSLFWLDRDILVLDYGQFTVGGSAREEDRGLSVSEGALWWRPGEGAPVQWPWRRQVPDVQFWSARDGQLLGTDGKGGLVLLDPGQGRRTPVRGEAGADSTSSHLSTVAVGPDNKVALLGSPGSQEGGSRVWVSRLAREGADATLTDRTAIPGGTPVHGLLGWRDGDVLALARVPAKASGPDEFGVMAVTPATGERRPVVTADSAGDLVAWQFARGLLETAEFVEGREPPDPVDPRLSVGLWAGGLLVVLAAFLLWRRRGHP